MIICWKDRTKNAFLILLSVLFFSISCKKENNEIGSDVIGNRSGFDIQVTDTFTVISYSSVADSVDTRFASYYMLGQMNDPVLGISTSNLVTQFLYPVSNFTFSGMTIDSAVVQLRYAGKTALYGKNTTQTIKLYELTEDLNTSLDATFFSNREYQINNTELGSYNGEFNLNDSVILTIDGTRYSYAPQMRIKITDPNFINKLQLAADSSFSNPTQFKSAFKGFYITAEQMGMAAGDGAVAYINMRTDNAESALVVYASKAGVQSKFEFPFGGTNEVKTNQFKHSAIPVTLQPMQSGNHQNTCYVQGGAGIKTRILIPNLLDLVKNNQVAIQSARIEFKLANVDTSIYQLPTRLNIWDAYPNGTRKMIADFSESLSYYGGFYDQSTQSYSFHINRYIQEVFNNYTNNKTNTNFGLNLFVPEDYPVSVNRAVFNTDSTLIDKKIKLILTYTVIK